ncbi:unnamed protein product [Heterobilharzia americana]|nr:unnamed protein product [Heterobilharzia americana]CAH8667545.1 unnamed protein product [Heterobilharzia americana]
MINQNLLENFISNFQTKLKEIYRNCDTHRLTEYNAAVKIQAWFRGIRTRCYLKFLERCTVNIQKTWRGYLGRKHYRRILSEAVVEFRQNKFSLAAAKIQSAWKGYLTRKYVFNFYSRKVYLSALIDVGEFVKNQLNEYEKEMKRLKFKEEQECERKRILNWAKSHHFLVSTYCQPGIYQHSDKTPSDRERLLLSVRQELIKDKKKRPQNTGLFSTSSSSKVDSVSSCGSEKESKQLPKIKGPFRNPEEVKKWINTPLSLSLRVSTDYFSLEKAQQSWKSEEWSNRLHDNNFYAGLPPSLPYERLLWTTSTYGPLPYGTKHFRKSEDEDTLNSTTYKLPRFRNVLRPISLFDKFNKEYIPGYATG